MTIEKKFTWSAIRVSYRGTLRGAYYTSSTPNGQCARWFFTFNAKECADPDVIDFVEYHSLNSVNQHRPSQCTIYTLTHACIPNTYTYIHLLSSCTHRPERYTLSHMGAYQIHTHTYICYRHAHIALNDIHSHTCVHTKYRHIHTFVIVMHTSP